MGFLRAREKEKERVSERDPASRRRLLIFAQHTPAAPLQIRLLRVTRDTEAHTHTLLPTTPLPRLTPHPSLLLTLHHHQQQRERRQNRRSLRRALASVQADPSSATWVGTLRGGDTAPPHTTTHSSCFHIYIPHPPSLPYPFHPLRSPQRPATAGRAPPPRARASLIRPRAPALSPLPSIAVVPRNPPPLPHAPYLIPFCL